MVIGFTNGCFDLLHEGHLHLLRECHRYCGKLVVAVNTDASVRRLKGPRRPRDLLATRIGNLKATGCADVIAVIDGDDDLRVMLSVMKPEILFKGAEYAPGQIVGWNLVD